ncbi:MAG TPA: LuxR C-terminal-related transcriptional regulator [Solirubrobacteraceae bacterium]|nr:LuxR C-terminal-related transcriptional regulator [Solirubrobacteraceae bacterium]
MHDAADADTDALLTRAQEALQSGEWSVAREALEAALEHDESAEALLGLGNALWWLGETGLSVRSLERAYTAFHRKPDPAQAVLAAVGLCLTYHASLGNQAAARGWLARAARLVEDFELAPLGGWVLLCRAVIAEEDGDAAAAERWSREAHKTARELADGDLELCALSALGSALVAMGRVEEGVALLDEAMAGSLGGEVEALDTVVLTSCQTIICCSRAGDLIRARQWVRAADDFNRRYGSPHLYAVCRTHYGSILFASGSWEEAEVELLAALKIGEGAEPALRAEALAKLAELRLAQGRVEEAERLVQGRSDEPAAVCVSAAIELVRAQPAVAASVLERRLGEVGWECLEAAALVELLAEASIARGSVPDDLASRVGRLAELGEAGRCEPMAARAQRALGVLAVAAGDARGAVPHLERALAGFRRLEMPLETGRTRLLVARALADDAREVAIAEAKQALAGCERLGAARDADAAAAFLRSLGVKAARIGPKGVGLLTKREREVLELLGEGLSNPEIAERLVVSRKTVEHHVARVLSKLGLRGRGEAAAYTVRERDSATK